MQQRQAAVRHGRRIALIAAILAAAALLLWAVVAQRSAGPAPRATLVMGADPDYRPFQFRDADGKAQGFDVDLARAVLAHRGLQLRVEFGEWDDVLERLQQGRIDLVPMFVSPERTRRFLFSKPFMLRYHVVFGHAGAAAMNSLDGLAGYRVAVQRAGLAWEALRAPGAPPVRLVETEVEPDAVAAVARGDADYALVPAGIGYNAAARPDLSGIVALSPPLLERQYAFAIQPGRPDLVPLVNAGLDAVRASGEQNRLYRLRLEDIAPGGDGRSIPAWVGIVLASLLLLLLALLARRRVDARAASAEAGPEGARRALMERLRQRIEHWRPDAPGFAFAEVRLLGLDAIEGSAGEATGRELQRVAAARLSGAYGPGHAVQSGVGTFLLLLDDIGAAAERTIGQVSSLLARRFEVAGLPVELRSRIGLARFPDDASDAAGLARAARLACDAALKQVTPGLRYHAGLEPDPRNFTLLAELREAIATGELGYAFQPKLDLAQRHWVGAELLVRWNHPRHGPLPPMAFVPLAEQAGAIGEMTLYLIRRGLEHCREWQRQGHAMCLSVNVSANDLADLGLVEAIIALAGGFGTRLMLEVTETDVMRDPERVVEAAVRLRRHDIRISLDDFGTGHSPLSNLRRLQVDELKIDRSFVTELQNSSSDQAIVRATIRLAHDLGARVTAEGIEDPATLQWLAEAGCDAAQGFGIARPMTPAQFAALLRAGSGPAASATVPA